MYLIDPKQFAENLIYFREKRSYSQTQLAKATTLIPGVIASLERGTVRPSDPQLREIASALKVKETDLILPRPPEMEYYESC